MLAVDEIALYYGSTSALARASIVFYFPVVCGTTIVKQMAVADRRTSAILGAGEGS